nr:MAG TPA: hypothetical protein [Caudoviricetes sp.]DAX88973.1 MAG TPA: hypothetical protein [Caudoviricetes sp.]
MSFEKYSQPIIGEVRILIFVVPFWSFVYFPPSDFGNS